MAYRKWLGVAVVALTFTAIITFAPLADVGADCGPLIDPAFPSHDICRVAFSKLRVLAVVLGLVGAMATTIGLVAFVRRRRGGDRERGRRTQTGDSPLE